MPLLVRFAGEILYRADEIRVHDDWTKKKLDDGKYKSSGIYSSPADPKLRKEYEECLKRLWEEIRQQRNAKQRGWSSISLSPATELLEGLAAKRHGPSDTGV